MRKQTIGETFFEVVLVILAVLISIAITMMVSKTSEVYQNSVANEYDALIDTLVPDTLDGQKEAVDTERFKASLENMETILEETEINWLSHDLLMNEEGIRLMFDKLYEEIEAGEQMQFASKAEMLYWMDKQKFANQNFVRSLITGYSKPGVIAMDTVLVAFLVVVILVFVNRKKLLFG